MDVLLLVKNKKHAESVNAGQCLLYTNYKTLYVNFVSLTISPLPGDYRKWAADEGISLGSSFLTSVPCNLYPPVFHKMSIVFAIVSNLD